MVSSCKEEDKVSLFNEEGILQLGNCEYYLSSTEKTVICAKYGVVAKTLCRYCKDRVEE